MTTVLMAVSAADHWTSTMAPTTPPDSGGTGGAL